jgi:hypothetical protein
MAVNKDKYPNLLRMQLLQPITIMKKKNGTPFTPEGTIQAGNGECDCIRSGNSSEKGPGFSCRRYYWNRKTY